MSDCQQPRLCPDAIERNRLSEKFQAVFSTRISRIIGGPICRHAVDSLRLKTIHTIFRRDYSMSDRISDGHEIAQRDGAIPSAAAFDFLLV